MERKSYRHLIKKDSKDISGPKTNKSVSIPNRIVQSSASLNSDQSKRSGTHKKWECDSHQFQLKPLVGANNFYNQVIYKMTHEGIYKPYPVVLTEFMNVGLIPLFGLEKDAPSHRLSVKKCNEGLQTEVSRITQEQNKTYEKPERMKSALPRNNNCQVCRDAYDDYFEHIEGYRHKKQIQMSLGTQYIRQLINEYEMAIFDENEEEDLALLTEIHLSLNETIPHVRQNFKHYLNELHKHVKK